MNASGFTFSPRCLPFGARFRCRGVGRVPGGVSVPPDSGCEVESCPHWRPDGFRSGSEAQLHSGSFRPGPKPQRGEGEEKCLIHKLVHEVSKRSACEILRCDQKTLEPIELIY